MNKPEPETMNKLKVTATWAKELTIILTLGAAIWTGLHYFQPVEHAIAAEESIRSEQLRGDLEIQSELEAIRIRQYDDAESHGELSNEERRSREYSIQKKRLIEEKLMK